LRISPTSGSISTGIGSGSSGLSRTSSKSCAPCARPDESYVDVILRIAAQ
jgi:hypothetical protein